MTTWTIAARERSRTGEACQRGEPFTESRALVKAHLVKETCWDARYEVAHHAQTSDSPEALQNCIPRPGDGAGTSSQS